MKTKKISRELYAKVILFFAILATSVYLLMFSILDFMVFLQNNSLEFLRNGIIFFSSFVVTMIITIKLRPAWIEFEKIRGIPKKTRFEVLRESLPSLLTVIFAMIFAFVFEWFFSSYLSIELLSNVAQNMLEQLLTINGILLGFSGVVLAQILSAIHNKGNWIYGQLITNRKDFLMLEELKKEVKVLEQVRPQLQADGGDLEYVGFKDGIVKVKLTGSCSGCPMSAMTLQWGVENFLKKHVPEVTKVEAVN